MRKNMQYASRNTQYGFTLIEVLLTITILTIGIIGVLRAYAVSINALEIGQDNIDAVCLLKEKAAEIEQIALEEEGLSPGTSSGEYEGRFEGFEWELEISASDHEELNKAKITVFNEQTSPVRKVSLVTYVENK